MARPLRIEYPGALYHVTSRGNARQKIFLDKKDFTEFIKKSLEVMKDLK
jgi:REP element-mobilizing transposase RayT